MGFRIIPYVKTEEDVYSLSDGCMEYIWKKFVDAGIHKQVFCQGKVSTPFEWLQLAKNPLNVLHTIWDEDAKQPVMVAWLNNIDKHSAQGHFAMFPEVWGEYTKELGDMTLKYWFDMPKNGGPDLRTVIGQVPEHLGLAVSFIRDKLGMTVLGIVPNTVYDVYKKIIVGIVVAYIEREVFENG
jgi:hypothetical protein